MAQTRHGVRAAPGLSGGAIGSSQSPSMKGTPAKSSPSPAARAKTSTQRVIESHWSASRPASPARWYSTQGTTTAASPQPHSACTGNGSRGMNGT